MSIVDISCPPAAVAKVVAFVFRDNLFMFARKKVHSAAPCGLDLQVVPPAYLWKAFFL